MKAIVGALIVGASILIGAAMVSGGNDVAPAPINVTVKVQPPTTQSGGTVPCSTTAWPVNLGTCHLGPTP